MDTVPPFLPSREDDLYLYGRGACDAKGIIAAQLAAVERLREAGAVLAAKLSLGALALNDVWFGGQTVNPWLPEEGASGEDVNHPMAKGFVDKIKEMFG